MMRVEATKIMSTNTTEKQQALEIRHGLSRAIFTKYLGPTNRRPSRIKAYDTEGFSAFVSKSEFSTDQEATEAAVQKLCAKMKWTGTLVSGGTKEGNVFVFVEGAR